MTEMKGTNNMQYKPHKILGDSSKNDGPLSLDDWLFTDENMEPLSINTQDTTLADTSTENLSPITVIPLYSMFQEGGDSNDSSHTDFELSEQENVSGISNFNVNCEIRNDMKCLEFDEDLKFGVRDIRSRPIFSGKTTMIYSNDLYILILEIFSRVTKATDRFQAGVISISNKYLKAEYNSVASLGSPVLTPLI